MEVKEIELDCPCCSTRLCIDVLTGTVVRSTAPQRIDETGRPQLDEERWGAAARRVQGRASEAGDEFNQALSIEQGKEARLDDLFEKAKRKLGGRGEGERS